MNQQLLLVSRRKYRSSGSERTSEDFDEEKKESDDARERERKPYNLIGYILFMRQLFIYNDLSYFYIAITYIFDLSLFQ